MVSNHTIITVLWVNYMKAKDTTYALLVFAVLVTLLIAIPTIKVDQGTSKLVLNNGFSIAETTYTNKTIDFNTGDPYSGYSYFTYESGGTIQAPSDNMYAMDTDVSGYAEFFGFDEFVEHSLVSASCWFKTTLLAGTYHFVPLGYFYQKTALETNTHWALALYWDSTGCDLYYNTDNGDTPSSVSLFLTAPAIGNPYNLTLQNFGTRTFVQVYDTVAATNLYSGNVTTSTYDATSLYAGFGQYSSGNGHIYGWFDDLCIIDSSVDSPTGGYGFSKIDAYVDEDFTHTFYDFEGSYVPILEIEPTVSNVTLLIQCWLNGTTFNASTLSEASSILRHNVNVTNINGTIVFSQSNFTYSWGIEYATDLFLFEYWVELDYSLEMNEVYSILLQMEIYYDSEE